MSSTVVSTSPPSNLTDTGPPADLSPPQYMYFYVTILNALIFLIGFLGNAMVIYVIVRMRTLRSRVNYFLVNLSIADLLVLIVCQPSAMLIFYTKDRWVLGYFMCKLVPFFEHWTLHASVLTLLVIGFDRYFTICRPLCEQISVCPTNTLLLILPTWIIACVPSLPVVFMTDLDEVEFMDGTQGQKCRTKISSLLARLFIISSFVLMFLVPLILLTFLYVSVISTLRMLSRMGMTSGSSASSSPGLSHGLVGGKGGVHPTTAKSRRQVSWMMVAIVVLFFVSFLPFKILTTWLIFQSKHSMAALGFESYLNLLSITRLVTYINSAGNPVIYAWMSPRFRRAFRLSLRCSRCSTDSPRRGSFSRRVPRNAPVNMATPRVLL